MTEPYYQDEFATIYHGDCRTIIGELEDDSVGLIIADPPYFRVKGDWWDNQWHTADGFAEWIAETVADWRRPLTDNGSVYVYASPQQATRVETAVAETFNVLNRLTWAKPSPHLDINKGASNSGRVSKERLRSYYANTEAIVFAEQQHGQDTTGRSEYAAAEAEMRAAVFEPLRLKMVSMLDDSGWSKDEINDAMGFAPNGMASSRYFGKSQWQLATAEHYARMQQITGEFATPYEDLRAEYEDLRAEYEDLRVEYEHLRRPFNVTAEVPYTDVWTFPTVPPGGKDRHPCEKPDAMLRHIIAASHRDDMPPVLDPFMGSGSTLRAAKDMGRKVIGIEIEERWCEIAANRLSQNALSLGV